MTLEIKCSRYACKENAGDNDRCAHCLLAYCSSNCRAKDYEEHLSYCKRHAYANQRHAKFGDSFPSNMKDFDSVWHQWILTSKMQAVRLRMGFTMEEIYQLEFYGEFPPSEPELRELPKPSNRKTYQEFVIALTRTSEDQNKSS